MRELAGLFLLVVLPCTLAGQQPAAEVLPPPVPSMQQFYEPPLHGAGCGQAAAPHCGVPTPADCAPPRQHCQCAECCRKRLIVVKQPCDGGIDERAPGDESGPGNPGIFVAPPATGRVYEESGGRGWSGLKIRFPELTLSLPSIELPSRYRYRERAHMRTDESIAPYMSTPAMGAQYTQYQGQPGATDERAPAEEGPIDERAPDRDLEEDLQRCDDQIKRLEDVERRVTQQLMEMQKCLQQLHHQQRPQPVPPPRPECLPEPHPRHSPEVRRTDYLIPFEEHPARPSEPIPLLQRLPPVSEPGHPQPR